MENTPPGESDSFPYEHEFAALPRLGSPEYVTYVQKTPRDQLPAEVLVRAFRELPPDGEAAHATLKRLFGRVNDRWEYCEPLAAFARRWRKERHEEPEDLLQDAFSRILSSLPGRSGEFAMRTWHTFCRRQFSDAWRAKHGRRGERLTDQTVATLSDLETPEGDLLETEVFAPPWQGTVEESHVEQVEAIVRRVVDQLSDPFIKRVAQEAWLSNQEQPRVSGRPTELGGASLMTRFKGKSRTQIHRALSHAKSQLAAALLIEADLEWSPGLEALLQRLSG